MTDSTDSQALDATARIVFTVNGPGEVSGWLFPLARALKTAAPHLSIVVCLLPCVYSTGAERSVLAGLGTVDATSSVAESFGLILRNRRPPGLQRDMPTLVFHLGGEVALTVLLAARLRAPMYAYAEHRLPWQFLFRKVFFNGLNRLPARQLRGTAGAVGELMVDAARLRRASAGLRQGERPTIGLFPGSREYMAEFLLPYYAVIVDTLSRERPEIDWVLARADFVRMAFLRDFPEPPADRTWQAHAVRFVVDGANGALETEGGTRIRILRGSEALAQVDYALTIPGTNTGELAASGVPMVVVVPTYVGHKVPLPGLAGHVGRLPLVGRALKTALGQRVLRHLPLLALPNRRAGRMLVPELVGQGLHPAILAALRDFLDHDTRPLSDALRAAMGEGGAAEVLAAEIVAFFAPPANAPQERHA